MWLPSMATSEDACLDALRTAAARLGESPTKAQYEQLPITPSSSTIVRVIGGWNEAKERAGLDTSASTGSRTSPKPDAVEIPDGKTWEELSADQRWHYKHRNWNAERSLQRRKELRRWVREQKEATGCQHCGITDPRVLVFHHRDSAEKKLALVDMVTYGYGKDRLRTEMEKCDVLCANCHRRKHYSAPESPQGGAPQTDRQWIYEYKRNSEGCRRCSVSDPQCLDFHHTTEEKTATISNMISGNYSRDSVTTEIQRCILLCANCHKIEHLA